MHKRFWLDFVGRVGAPVFAATLVACLLSERFEATHAVLMIVGIGLMALDHLVSFHGRGHGEGPGGGE